MKYKVCQGYHSFIELKVEANDMNMARDLAYDLLDDMSDEEYAKQLVANAELDEMEIYPEEGVTT